MPNRNSNDRFVRSPSSHPERVKAIKRSSPKSRVDRREDNNRFRNIMKVGLVGIVSGIVAGLCFSPAMAIRTVNVTGLEVLTASEAEAIKSASIVPPKTNLIIGRLGKVVLAIASNPAVKVVQIHRKFPGEVTFHVTPKVPVARVVSAGEEWESDVCGSRIRRASSEHKLPKISIEPMLGSNHTSSEVALTTGIKLVTLSGINSSVRAESVDIDQNGELCLNMRDNIKISFGPAEEVDAKLTLVRRIYEQRPAIGAEVTSLDVSVPGHPTCVPRTSKRRLTAQLGSASHAGSGITPTL